LGPRRLEGLRGGRSTVCGVAPGFTFREVCLPEVTVCGYRALGELTSRVAWVAWGVREVGEIKESRIN